MFLVYICKGNTKVFIIKMFSRKTLLKVLHLTFIKYCLSNIIVLFTFVYNSLISVIYYKVYNEPPGVGTATKILISVIYYNVYNVMGWAPGSRKGGTGAILHAWHHRGTRQGAKVQRATLHTRHHRGARQGAKVQRATLHTRHHRGTRNGRKGGTGAILHAWQHRGTRQGAKVQRATLHTRHHRGARQGAKVQRATLHTRHHRGTRNGRKQKNRRPDGRRFLNRFIFSKVCKVEPFYFVTKDLLYFCFH